MRQLLHKSIFLVLPVCIRGREPDVTSGYACISCRGHSTAPVIAQTMYMLYESNFFEEHLLWDDCQFHTVTFYSEKLCESVNHKN